VLQRFTRREDRGDIFEDKWSVSEKIEFILKVISGRGSLRFAELFASAASRSEVICTFLALLELIRLRQLVCSQPEAFSEIEIRLAAPPADVAQTSGLCEAKGEMIQSNQKDHRSETCATPATAQPVAAPANQSTDAGNVGQASSLSQT
jgi:segregation and condensation protein A